MNLKKVLKSTAKTTSLIAIILSFSLLNPVIASAHNFQLAYYNRGTIVFDSFDEFNLPPHNKAFYTTTLIGEQNGQSTFVFNQNCAYQVCVKAEKQGFQKFIRSSIKPLPISDVLIAATFSDQPDGYWYDYPGDWTPEVNKPVVFEAKVRFSENMKWDGTGGGVGDVGFRLWNNPFGQGAPDYANANIIGFQWNQTGALVVPGVSTLLAKSAVPVHSVPAPEFDAQEWNLYKFVWSVNSNGVQHVNYYLNNNLIGSTDIEGAGFQNLSLKVNIENQTLFGGSSGFPELKQLPVTSEQYVDIDFLLITKL